MRPSPQRHPLAVLRGIIGITQKEMAEFLECSVPTVQAVELGKLKLSIDLAERVHFQTGASTEWLLAGDISQPAVSSHGEPYTKDLFDKLQASLLVPKPTSTAAFFELWRTWSMFIKHIKILSILYAEAYKRGKVPVVFHKSLTSAKELFEKTVGQEESIAKKLEPLAYQDIDPVDLFELTETLEIFEADTYEELKRKLKHTKEPIPSYVRPYFRAYEKRLRSRAQK